MDSKQAKNLVQQQAQAIREWVCDHCGEDEYLIPLALVYVNKRLADHDWEQVRKYDEKQPVVEFIHGLVNDALESFSHGVWFGECSETIHYWIAHYGINNDNKRQDAEDYVKNKLTKDNFARFRSYNKESNVRFTTYISKIIRNLLIDYLRKKTPATESLESLESEHESGKAMTISTIAESQRQQNLEEIGQWFFTASAPQGMDGTVSHSIDIPDEIKLSPRDRLFLRAIYKDGMSVEEAGRLPGMNMGKGQSHRYHRRLRARVKKILKAMGYETIQSLLYPN